MNSIIEKELYDVESRRVTNEEYLLNRQNSNPLPDSFINYPDAKNTR